MPRPSRPPAGSVLAVPLAVLALLLTGCGDAKDSVADVAGLGSAADAPTSASLRDFCSAYQDARSVGQEKTAAEQVEAAHDAGRGLIETGTPSDMSKDARAGFEVYADAIADVSADQVAKIADGDAQAAFDALEIDGKGQQQVGALVQYASSNCS